MFFNDWGKVTVLEVGLGKPVRIRNRDLVVRGQDTSGFSSLSFKCFGLTVTFV